MYIFNVTWQTFTKEHHHFFPLGRPSVDSWRGSDRPSGSQKWRNKWETCWHLPCQRMKVLWVSHVVSDSVGHVGSCLDGFCNCLMFKGALRSLMWMKIWVAGSTSSNLFDVTWRGYSVVWKRWQIENTQMQATRRGNGCSYVFNLTGNLPVRLRQLSLKFGVHHKLGQRYFGPF